MTRIRPPEDYVQGDLNVEALAVVQARSQAPLRFYVVGRGLNVVSDDYGPTMVGVYREDPA